AAAGLDPDNVRTRQDDTVDLDKRNRPKAWKDIWSAGQGVGAVQEILSARALVDQLAGEFNEARQAIGALAPAWTIRRPRRPVATPQTTGAWPPGCRPGDDAVRVGARAGLGADRPAIPPYTTPMS